MNRSIAEIREKIASAALKSGRSAEDITLVAVTKNVPIDIIREAIECGITDIGENRVQEFFSKGIENLTVNRHLIGHLQRNKVRQIVGKVGLIQSVDSLPLLSEINSQAAKLGIVQDVLAQINISGEESKFGLPPEIYGEFAAEAKKLENVALRGLMTIPPLTADTEFLRSIFCSAREMFERANEPWDILSMGMSSDFELAIECGANMVRVGSGIFGGRG